MIKNQANQNVSFQAINVTTGLPVTTGTPVIYFTKDGTRATGTGSSTHKGNGEWSYAPTQAETNGDHIAFTFTLTNAINTTVNVFTQTIDSQLAAISTSLESVNAVPTEFVFDQILTDISGIAVGTPSILVDKDDSDLWHVAYRKGGTSVHYRQFQKDTGAMTAEVEMAASGSDTVMLFYDGDLRYIRINGKSLWWYTSTDNGATWGSAVNIHTTVAAGHYEDLGVCIMPNGNILLLAELEASDKLDSSIEQFVYDGTSWTRTELHANDGSTDWEGQMPFVVDGITYRMGAYVDTAIGESYQENVLTMWASTDNAATWDSGTVVMSQTSHVEYDEPLLIGTDWWIPDSRGYTSQDPTSMAGLHNLGPTFAPKKTLAKAGWTVGEGFAVVGKDSDGKYLDLGDDTGIRGFMYRHVSDGTDCDIRITDFECKGIATPDIRIMFAATDGDEVDNHYVWVMQATEQLFFKRVAGTYVRIPAGDGAAAIALNTKYDVRVTFNAATNTKTLYLDGVQIATESSDATFTDGGVGISCSGHADPETVHPVRMRSFEVVDEFYDDFESYSYFVQLGDRGTIVFTRQVFRNGQDIYALTENRDIDEVVLWRGVNTNSTVTPDQVRAQTDAALLAYDGPTRAETTADQQAVMAKLTKPIKIWNNPQRANHIEIIRGDAYDGDGTPGSSHLKFSWDFGKDITGKAFTMTIRGKDDAKTDTPLMQVTGTGAGQLAEPSIASSDTEALPITESNDELIFDVEVTHATDSKESQVGTVTVVKDVT